VKGRARHGHGDGMNEVLRQPAHEVRGYRRAARNDPGAAERQAAGAAGKPAAASPDRAS
jgi:hypothetical protein